MTMETMSLGFIQFDVRLGDIDANMETVSRELERLSPPSSALLALPELWATGFAYPRLGELAARTPSVLEQVQELAGRYNCWLAGSLPEQEADSGRVFNTLYVTGPRGTTGYYRKQQLFAPMQEDRHFSPGSSPGAIPSELGPIAGLVCFDLRFADIAQDLCGAGAKVLVVSAQWPAARRLHWQILLKARAIENQVLVLACNRCGTTADTVFAGHSTVIGPDGGVLTEAGDEPTATMVQADPRLQEEIRSGFSTVGPKPYRYRDADKIIDLKTAGLIVQRNKQMGRRTVFTNGCFDILHAGHVDYLEKARKLGDFLIVGLNSDRSVRAIKGPERPVNRESDRARVLAALGCVDAVVLFDEETPLNLIRELLPDVLVKGADWAEEDIVGGREVRGAGGQVVTVPLVENRSTTRLIKKLQGRGE